MQVFGENWMSEKKRNYNADTFTVLDMNLQHDRAIGGHDLRVGSAGKRRAGKVSPSNQIISREIIQRIIDKMRDI